MDKGGAVLTVVPSPIVDKNYDPAPLFSMLTLSDQFRTENWEANSVTSSVAVPLIVAEDQHECRRINDRS